MDTHTYDTNKNHTMCIQRRNRNGKTTSLLTSRVKCAVGFCLYCSITKYSTRYNKYCTYTPLTPHGGLWWPHRDASRTIRIMTLEPCFSLATFTKHVSLWWFYKASGTIKQAEGKMHEQFTTSIHPLSVYAINYQTCTYTASTYGARGA